MTSYMQIGRDADACRHVDGVVVVGTLSYKMCQNVSGKPNKTLDESIAFIQNPGEVKVQP